MSDTKHMALSELLPQEGIDKLNELANRHLFAVLNSDAYADEQEFHKALVDVLEEYKDSLLEKGCDYEYLAYALEAQLMKHTRKPEYKVGMRVRVHDGTGEKLLGEGVYEGDVKAYFIVMPDGSLQSLQNAEIEPPANEVPEGAEVVTTDDNPKIRLDSGEVVYGCQVWWEPIEKEHQHHESCGCGH